MILARFRHALYDAAFKTPEATPADALKVAILVEDDVLADRALKAFRDPHQLGVCLVRAAQHQADGILLGILGHPHETGISPEHRARAAEMLTRQGKTVLAVAVSGRDKSLRKHLPEYDCLKPPHLPRSFRPA